MPLSQGAALDFIGREFGGTLRDIEAVVAVNVTPIELVPSDADRVSLVMANLGANPIWIFPRADVSSTQGIRLGAGGGLIGFNVVQDSLLCVLQWWAVALVGPNSVTTIRVRRETLNPPSEAVP